MPAHAVIESPIGRLFLETSSRGLRRLEFMERRGALPRGAAARARPRPATASADDGTAADAMLARATRQVEEYIAGSRWEFDLPVDTEGSPFQRRVWQAIARIPFGRTASYAEVAAQAGHAGAARAAGSACAANPVAIVVPCHRVVGAGNAMHGFGGGLETKRWLLDHESRVATGAQRDAHAARRWTAERRRPSPVRSL